MFIVCFPTLKCCLCEGQSSVLFIAVTPVIVVGTVETQNKRKEGRKEGGERDISRHGEEVWQANLIILEYTLVFIISCTCSFSEIRICIAKTLLSFQMGFKFN